MLHKKWVIRQADKEVASAISEQFNIDPFLAFLLVSRGLTDDLAVQEFLHPGQALCAPEGFADMEAAAARLQQALDSGERICVYGDYDCDGVTATALLYSFLEAMGGNVIYYIPDRETEGYGLNKGAIDTLAAKGTGLIVTVDNGISSVEEAEYIYRLGMQLVVTDHHQVGEQLPRAEAVVNPHRTDNQLPFTDFCGVGVAFKLACCLYDGEPAELLEQFGDLVAIGTMGDLVPLVGENRALVQAGLRTLQEEPRPGLYALLQAAGAGEELSGKNNISGTVSVGPVGVKLKDDTVLSGLGHGNPFRSLTYFIHIALNGRESDSATFASDLQSGRLRLLRRNRTVLGDLERLQSESRVECQRRGSRGSVLVRLDRDGDLCVGSSAES